LRFCLVELEGDRQPVLAVAKGDALVALDAPPSLRDALEKFGDEGLIGRAKEASGRPVPLGNVKRWLPPVPNPRTFRDFYAFEQHVKTARAKRGQEMIPDWYEIAVFYFSNPTSMRGHLETVTKPSATKELDYELEVGCVLGRDVQDVSGKDAEDAIFGYMVMNDYSARDLQRQEMKCMLGPAKGKDFATAIGPWVVTKDEIADKRVGPGRYDLVMLARKNGKEISHGNWKDLTHDFTKMVERASRDVKVFRGDVLGSGTVGTGCILEIGTEASGGWLEPGDSIELEIERLGTLTNQIV
jgi:fumarylacetoacetate (FAA) hydrolase